MTHARLAQARLFDMLRACADTGKPMPTDVEIMEAFNLHSIVSARSLVADLSDAGKITIRGFGPDRVITIGKQATLRKSMGRVVPSVVKRYKGGGREPSVDEITERLKAIAARPRADAPAQCVAPTPVRVDPPAPPALAAIVDRDPAPVAIEPAPAAAPSPPALAIKRLSTAPAKPKRAAPTTPSADMPRQVNVHVPPSLYPKIAALAEQRKQRVSACARDLIVTALSDAPAAPTAKGAIPAPVSAAAIRAGVGIADFAAMLMQAGLAAYERDLSGGAA